MSKNDLKRQKLFDRYVANRNLLIGLELTNGDKNTYLCPICLKSHKSLFEDDPLTLEDAPPKSLGGRPALLTCKSCNNKCGHKIDVHLVERLKQIDTGKFHPNSEFNAKIRLGSQVFNAIISVDSNGKVYVFHSEKNNNPIKLKEQMLQIKGGEIINIDSKRFRIIPERLQYALLKTGYILACKKFGASMMFHSCFNIVREQLQSPMGSVYPSNFWFVPPYPEEMEGVYFILDEGLECILVLL